MIISDFILVMLIFGGVELPIGTDVLGVVGAAREEMRGAISAKSA